MALLTKQQIVDVDDRQFEDIPVVEWDGEVRILGLSGTQRDAYEAGILDQRGGERKVMLTNARAKLVALCLVDENFNRLFTQDDVRQLGRKSAAALERCFDKARELSGMAPGDVERLTENFDDDPSDASTSE